MKCIIHLGHHKTGTTSLQDSFTKMRDELVSQGVLYPKSIASNDPLAHGAHHPIPNAIAKGDDDTVDRLVEALKEEVDSYPDLQTVFISSETFSVLNKRSFAKFTSKLAATTGWDISLLMYFRDQVSFLHSLYTQRTKELSISMDFSEFVLRSFNNLNALLDYGSYVAKLESATGLEVVARPFPTKILGWNIQKSVLEDVFSVPPDLLTPQVQSGINRSPGPKTIFAARSIRGFIDLVFPENTLRWTNPVLRKATKALKSGSEDYGWNVETFYALTPEICDMVFKQYEKKNMAFRKRLGGSEAEIDDFLNVPVPRGETNIFDPDRSSAADMAEVQQVIGEVVISCLA